MKKISLLSFATLTLIACSSSDDVEERDDFLEDVANAGEEVEEEEDLDELNAGSDALFLAYVGIDRYEDPEEDDFTLQRYKDDFYYYLPHEAEFNRTEKSDHITYFFSEVIDGSQYIINVDDYSESDADVTIDAGFTKFVHDGFVDVKSPEIVHERELTHIEGAFGYYTVGTYTQNETDYTVDQAHFGFGDLIVGLAVTGTPYGESYNRVTDFIGYFELQ